MNDWQIDALASLDGTVRSFKQFITEQAINEIDEYFILEFPRIDYLFQQALDQLADDSHWMPDFLYKNQASVIALTIDGDFLIANDQHTWLIERSFYIEDSECFIIPINKWWQAYFKGTLDSAILSS